MPKNLVIVESPAKARTIERYLGPDYRVLASYGHVRDLPENPGKGKFGVDVDHDFAPEYVISDDRRKQVSDIEKAAKGSDQVYLATDLDREGEAIAWHVAEAAHVPPEKTLRVTFNEITESAIRDAFAHPRQIDMDLVDAQQTRRIVDRLVGYTVCPPAGSSRWLSAWSSSASARSLRSPPASIGPSRPSFRPMRASVSRPRSCGSTAPRSMCPMRPPRNAIARPSRTSIRA
jgi:reverse gyrase